MQRYPLRLIQPSHYQQDLIVYQMSRLLAPEHKNHTDNTEA